MALASAAQEAIWMRQLLSDLKHKSTPTVIFEDNQSIWLRIHFVHGQVSKDIIEQKYCKMEDMITDMLTKGLNQQYFSKPRKMAGVKPVTG